MTETGPVEALEGTTYPARPYRLCREKVNEFISATGDDSDRWTQAAPPGFVAALLFVTAPDLLDDARLSGGIVHGDQTFLWHSPLRLESELEVTGSVDRVRVRGEVAFITFSLTADNDGDRVVEGKSTFLVGGATDLDEVPVGYVDERGRTSTVGTTLPAARSASRADLVRYAAATRDWNPIHWDHDSAVAAGLGGVVVHGLLQSAWLTQVAAAAGDGDRPLASARFRYTSLLRPAQQATIEGDLSGDKLELRLVADGATTVTGRFEVIR